ncbi:MAG: DUF4118 domain-containing protein, partial [Lachnospiraceae bacterium]|nr:DUF4118 domain-containing protein [Lachnospiraceae bacterium]
MNRFKSYLGDLLKTVLILVVSFLICLFMQLVSDTGHLIPAIFTVAVFLITLLTRGYIYGVGASLVSVLALNYAFAFPYFEFNFTIPENFFSAVIMLTVTLITSALTTKIRMHEKMMAESEKEKMRANLLRAVSHDLRTPLTTIYGSSSAIIENYDKLTKEQQLELISGIREDADWLTHMVENLLSVTRIDGKGLNLVKTPVVLEELVDSVLVKFQKRYAKQKVTLEMPDEFISIPMDPVLIEQVIINLLENAVKHAKGMKTLYLRITKDDNRVLFEVEDDGVGFVEKHMGIGLTVCETIVKAYGGEFTIKNGKCVGKIES